MTLPLVVVSITPDVMQHTGNMTFLLTFFDFPILFLTLTDFCRLRAVV